VGSLDDELNALEGDLSAVEGLALTLVEQHADQLGPTARGLHHCSTRALETLRRVRDLHERLAEAAQVSEGNDPTRLSAAANRYRPRAARPDLRHPGGGRAVSGPRILAFRKAALPAREEDFEAVVGDIRRAAAAVYALGMYLDGVKEEVGANAAILLSEVIERRVEMLQGLTEQREG
jgi:hypothetical protein